MMFKLLIHGSENQYQCRFCLEEQKTLRRLISPCSCTGTQKYVHISCLQKYLSLGKLSCPVCTKPFHFFVNDRKLIRIMANFCSWCYQAIYKQNIIIANRLLFDIHRGETMFSWKFVFSRFCEFALFRCLFNFNVVILLICIFEVFLAYLLIVLLNFLFPQKLLQRNSTLNEVRFIAGNNARQIHDIINDAQELFPPVFHSLTEERISQLDNKQRSTWNVKNPMKRVVRKMLTKIKLLQKKKS